MSEGKEHSDSPKTVGPEHCPPECEIGLDECAECGFCDHCPDAAPFSEEELPPHWRRFMESSKKKS